MRPFRFALLASTVCLLWCVPAAGADVSVGSASAFSNSVGVDTHLTFANTAYGDWPRLVAALNDLGVRHASDSAYGNPDPSWGWFNGYFQNAVELAASHGIRFAFQMGKPGYQGGTIDQLVSVLSGPLRNAVEAVEAPNEFDSSGVADWASQLAAYDRQLYAAVKASPSLRSLPVIGPSLVGDGAPAELGDQQSSLDFGNIHPYTGGLAPSPSYIASQLQRISVVSGRKPVWATEMGYYNALNAPPGALQPVSEAVSAVYLLREFLENFKNGIARTYAYELIDDNPDPANSDIQQHFGLLRNDYTPKPAFIALKNLLSLVGQQAPATLTPLQLSTTAGPSDLRQLVLQQADHTYLIVLWRTASIWNVTHRQALSVPAAGVTLELPNATSAASANPLTTNTLTPLTLSGGKIHINLAADPTIIQIKTTTNTAGQSRVSARHDSLAVVARNGSLTLVAAKNSSAILSRASRPVIRLPRRGVSYRACRRPAGLSSRAVPTLRPTLRWLSARLRTLPCRRDAGVAVLQLYATGAGQARRGGSPSQRLVAVANRLLDGRNASSAARWIVIQARRQAQRRHGLLVRFVVMS